MDIALRDRTSEIVVRALHKFVDFMNSHGHAVNHIQTDRGTEFFGYQDGEAKDEDLTQFDKETLKGKFTSECKKIGIKHSVIPTASHEKHAEAHFSWISRAIAPWRRLTKGFSTTWSRC